MLPLIRSARKSNVRLPKGTFIISRKDECSPFGFVVHPALLGVNDVDRPIACHVLPPGSQRTGRRERPGSLRSTPTNANHAFEAELD
jgi:hypothetical protein